MSSYKCSKCDYYSEVKGNVKRHISNMCDGAQLIEDTVKLKCDICNKEYKTELSLITHKKGCVAKKAVVVKEYIDAVEVMDKIKSLTLLVNSLLTSNEQVINENKDLKKRLDRLEKEKKKSSDGFEAVSEEYCSKKCSHRDLVEEEIKDKAQICEVFKIENEGSLSMGVPISVIENGLTKDAKVFHSRIDIINSDQSYYFEPEGKKKHVNKLKIIVRKIRCKEIVTLEKKMENDIFIFSCEKHRQLLGK